MADIIICNDLGPGKMFTVDNNIYTVIDIEHNKTAMRQMVVKVKVKNLRSGAVTDMSFTGGDKVQLIYLDKKKMSYLYDDGDFSVFMDTATYEQVSIPNERLKWEKQFLKDEQEVTVTYYGSEIIGIELPVKVALKIVHTDDAVRGDTINKPQKDATLETGLVIKVPMFIKNGETVYVRTDTGEYDSRANN